MSDKNKAWTPEQLANHIKEICGPIVAAALEPLNKRVTDYGNWIDGAKGAGGIPHAVGRSAMTPEALAKNKGLVFGGILASLAASKCDLEKAVKHAKEIQTKARSDEDKAMNGEVVKALEASTGAAGGFLIAPEQSEDFIDLLTPRAIVRSFGTPTVNMDTGTMQISKLNAASTAYYIGENRDATASQQDFGMKRLTARKLAVLVPISNDLIRRGGSKVNTIVRNDALRSASLKEDVTFIRSQGTEFTPKGLRYLAAAANVLAATGGAPTLAGVTFDLGRLVLALEEANVVFANPGWMMAPRTKQYLMTVRDGLGNYAFRAEMLTGRLWGYPYKTTTQIPKNLGAGTESEIYLVDFDDIIIGQTLAVEVAMSTEASYIDPTDGQLKSAFSQDQTLLRVLMEHDIQARYDQSISVLTEVTWAPTV
jgi:HK97 family phage major capsid protein